MTRSLERALTIIAGLSLMLAVLASLPARAQLRAPDGEAARRPFYKWEVSLDRDTKAVVGPVDAERVLKLRLDRPEGSLLAPLPDETVIVCVGRYCESADLGADPESALGKGPEVDFTPYLQSNPDNYSRAYLTIQRKNPSPLETITLTMKVETDKTVELPQFDILSEVAPMTHPSERSREHQGGTHAIDRDGQGSKIVDVTLPEAGATVERQVIESVSAQ